MAKGEVEIENDDRPLLLMMITSQVNKNNDIWYIDSGCLSHMTGHGDWLDNFDEKRKSSVRFADNRKCTIEYGLYIKPIDQNHGALFICLYVDDLLITSSSSKGIEELKESLKGEFEMTDLGRFSYFLGLEFQHTKIGLFIHQKKYLLEVLNKFNLMNCNALETRAKMNLKLDNCEREAVVDATLFRQIVGSLRDICHSRP
ncbi:PREDICTED: uncharacterized protein LOC109332568 [Lupinus angustifolius]|uniref:uncharacterized protein LOC109332568 n=1 Tax=Lupinus angustifolius TaxID=3871 RepID=UPI00092FC67E|nr:PREDICTED: uncharacterized protein LOC109332568 [Lupinus angustifolius]